jgi:hypothetical protein
MATCRIVEQRNIIGFLFVDASFHTMFSPPRMQGSSSNNSSLTVALGCRNPYTIFQVVKLRSAECRTTAKRICMLTLKMSLYFGWDERAVLQDCRIILRLRCPRGAERERERERGREKSCLHIFF